MPDTASTTAASVRKPRDDELDVFGLTHAGRVRKHNNDHFLIASIHKRMEVRLTSLTGIESGALGGERLGFLAVVADGVGGSVKGEAASRVALNAVTDYVNTSMNAYFGGDTTEAHFTEALQEAALRCHAEVQQHSEAREDFRGMATTLTLFLGVWPWIYLLQVGDSRYYLYRDGALTQVSRDQTMAQELLEQGVFTRADAAYERWAHVLSSSIGGQQTAPVVTRIKSEWESVHLMCSDGLTKHVSDDRIRERLASMASARQACENLLQDALDGGGSDNITIIVGRTVPKEPITA